MNYRLALIVSMMSARTAVISISALIAVLQFRHLKMRQFHRVPFGASTVDASIPKLIGIAQLGFGQLAISVSNSDFRRWILA
ncbi:hypothetical protein [Burkholderia gladioli]|uniref:hypothetical protein n=1 Tax=Burkholderia gladioli TaxID=28095 RepID=UPI00164057CF|nr:hypothetical protein [Burkholderia gladioli]